MRSLVNKEKRDIFVANQLKWSPNANEQVLQFIYNFAWHKASTETEHEQIRCLFMDGYCYYFATMLKTAFKRGEICWCAPYGHFVWLDTNGVPYDIEGVSTAEAKYYIPETYIEDGLADFMQVPGVTFNASKEYINVAIKQYEFDVKNNCVKTTLDTKILRKLNNAYMGIIHKVPDYTSATKKCCKRKIQEFMLKHECDDDYVEEISDDFCQGFGVAKNLILKTMKTYFN